MSLKSFSFRQIKSSESLGETLRKKRKEFGLTLEEISSKLKISKKYLEAIENDNWSVFPGEIYLNNFLKKYSHYLEITGFEKINPVKQNVRDNKNKFQQDLGQEVVRKSLLISYPNFLRNILFFLVICGLIFYLGFKVNALISPPKINLFFPQEDLIITGHTIELRGQVDNEVRLMLNGEDLGIDEKGFFQKTLDLKSGLNIIKLQAKKRYGKESVIIRRINVIESGESN